MRLIGLEPTRPEPPDPKSGASTNFATSAFVRAKIRNIFYMAKFSRAFLWRPAVSEYGCLAFFLDVHAGWGGMGLADRMWGRDVRTGF